MPPGSPNDLYLVQMAQSPKQQRYVLSPTGTPTGLTAETWSLTQASMPTYTKWPFLDPNGRKPQQQRHSLTPAVMPTGTMAWSPKWQRQRVPTVHKTAKFKWSPHKVRKQAKNNCIQELRFLSFQVQNFHTLLYTLTTLLQLSQTFYTPFVYNHLT